MEGKAHGDDIVLTQAAWIAFFHRIASLLDPEREGRTGQIAGLHRLAKAIEVNRQAAGMIADWPHAFHEYLAALQARGEPSFSLPRTFGRLYRWLYTDSHGAEFAFLRQAFENYLHEHWWGLICRRNHWIQPQIDARVAGRTTTRSIALAAGATPALVRRLHLAGQIQGNTVELPSGRRAWSFPVSQIEPIATLVSDGLTLKAAAAYLAIPRRRIRELIDAKLIAPLLSAGGHGRATWLLSRRRLDELARSDHSQDAVPNAEPCVDPVPIRQILKAWRLDAGAFPALVEALRGGEIPTSSHDGARHRLGDILLSRGATRTWLTRWRHLQQADLSITEAAEVLEIKEQVAFELVRRGHLGSQPSSSGHARRISWVSLENFRERYLSLVEAAELLGTSPRLALQHLKVRPVTGPTVDGCRQYFYLRTEISHLLPSPTERTQERHHDEP